MMGFKIKEKKMNVLALFEGVGGMTLGLERTGKFKTIAMVENAKDRIRVLKNNHPNVPLLGDIRNVGSAHVYGGTNCIYESCGSGKIIKSIHYENIDVITGGFPCQGFSVGGKKRGLEDERSGLWKDMYRLIKDTNPKWVIIENVERLRKTGLGIVLRDLASIFYDAEGHCITARSVGYDHQRDRLFIIAYPCGIRCDNGTWEGRQVPPDKEWKGEGDKKVGERCKPKPGAFRSIFSRGEIKNRFDANADRRAAVRGLRRVTNGIPKGVDEIRRRERIDQLGNAVVPDIPEILGQAIWEVDKQIYGGEK